MMACAAPGQAGAVNALAKRYFVVNAMIRLAGISFCRTQGGAQNREQAAHHSYRTCRRRTEGGGWRAELPE